MWSRVILWNQQSKEEFKVDAGIKIRLCHDRIRFKDFLFLKPLGTVKHARPNISNINALIKISHKDN